MHGIRGTHGASCSLGTAWEACSPGPVVVLTPPPETAPDWLNLSHMSGHLETKGLGE